MVVFHDILPHDNAPDCEVDRFWKELEAEKAEIVSPSELGWGGGPARSRSTGASSDRSVTWRSHADGAWSARTDAATVREVKVVILAGGFGTRISEESAIRPKPMVEIGGRPILWHIMKIYASHGVDEFVICAGYRGYMIKEYFANYFLHMADVTIDLRTNAMTTHSSAAEPWKVTVVDTGDETMTGGRLKRIREFVGGETFCMTYGDCVSNVDIGDLAAYHARLGVLATLTAIQPPGRFGALGLHDGEEKIASFHEKPSGDGGWVNGGFFVLEPAALDYIDGDASIWEREPLERLARDGQLAAYRHAGYWQNMDTLRDKAILEQQWASEEPPWKTW
jgi:glucose-1-phosphate cytidylyltransferase